MFPYFTSKTSYTCIEEGDVEEEQKPQRRLQPGWNSSTISIGPVSTLLLAILFLSSIVSTWILFFSFKSSMYQAPESDRAGDSVWVCQQPSTRREWRRLEAVQCLSTKPSKLRNNGSLYDEFPWVHKDRASYSKYKDSVILSWTDNGFNRALK